jgi:tetratricopeptide (TPR) repeat protein
MSHNCSTTASTERAPLALILCGLAVFLLTGIADGASIEPRRLSAASPAQTTKTSTQERLNRVGADLMSGGGRIPEAVRELKEILALDPRSAEGHFLLGIAYRMLSSAADRGAGAPGAEMMGEAVAEFRQALALNPGLVPARFYLAHVYLDLGRPERAREELEDALVQHPGQPQFMALLGEAERQRKNPRRSLELNRQALQTDESFAQSRYYLALALLDLGQRDEGIRELERVVQSGPKAVEAYLSLGAAYLEAGRLDAALHALQEGTQIDPARPDIRIQLARAYRSKGLLDKAEEQLKIAMPAGTAALASLLYPQVESDLYLEQGLVRLQRGRLEAAAEAFQKVLDMDSDHGPANRYMAEVYLLRGLYPLSLERAVLAEKLGFPLPQDQRKLLDEKLRGKEMEQPR